MSESNYPDRLTSPRRIKLLIAYDGTDYCGWQRQQNGPSIQGEIEKRLSTITCEEIVLHGAGRTDAGVHANGMVAHFDTHARISDHDLTRGLNSMLPGAIRILKVDTCSPEFHARFSATGKIYHYHLFTGDIQPPLLRFYTHHLKVPLNHETMSKCMEIIRGCHDFSSFENSGSRDKSVKGGRGAVRTIYKTNITTEKADTLIFEFIGDGFLKNMVRNLVGTILEVGRGKIEIGQFRAILEAADRSTAGPTAPANGLFLQEVLYSQKQPGNQ